MSALIKFVTTSSEYETVLERDDKEIAAELQKQKQQTADLENKYDDDDDDDEEEEEEEERGSLILVSTPASSRDRCNSEVWLNGRRYKSFKASSFNDSMTYSTTIQTSMKGTGETSAMAPRTLSNFELKVYDAVLRSDSWLALFAHATENLPVPICIASASSRRRGFPLLHANAKFIKTFGYSIEEVIGRNCNFLQDVELSEKLSIEEIRKGLSDAKVVKVEISNVTKQGERLRNLLTMKPIFDQHGE
jgi:PAS domain S-box-containing protein